MALAYRIFLGLSYFPLLFLPPLSSSAMPKYHLVTGARSMLNGDMMELLCTIRPRRMLTYQWDKPIGAFLWPMNSLQQVPGERELDYDDLETYLAASDYYWIARVYKSYSGNLDAYIKWKGENRVTRYILEFDPADVTIGADYDGWPQPRDFYLARAAIRTTESWTLEEYNAIPQQVAIAAAIQAVPAAIQAVPEAMDDDEEPTMEDDEKPTMEEGGTVVLCRGLFLFLFSCPPRPGFHFFVTFCFEYFS